MPNSVEEYYLGLCSLIVLPIKVFHEDPEGPGVIGTRASHASMGFKNQFSKKVDWTISNGFLDHPFWPEARSWTS